MSQKYTDWKRFSVHIPHRRHGLLLLVVLVGWMILPACQGSPAPGGLILPTQTPAPVGLQAEQPTSMPQRKPYEPGELVDYIAQTGDTLPALASHFHTTEKEIMEANPIIPREVTTLPPGLPMKIPIYYQPLWGSSYQIIPDSLFINGPAQIHFDTVEFVDSHPGWLKNYTDFADGKTMRGGEIINYVAQNYSVSPKVLLTVLEYQAGALSQKQIPGDGTTILGFKDTVRKRVSQQLAIAADLLNDGYYGWRTGNLKSFEHLDGRLEIPDPWQNAATVSLRVYFSRFLAGDAYDQATQSEGWYKTYMTLFGDPWEAVEYHIPGSLIQPMFRLPFPTGQSWTLTGGPHTGWGDGLPWAALDFAPLGVKGCSKSTDWVTAVADGVIIRTGDGIAVLDLDGDGDEHTGWVIFYLHLDKVEKVSPGVRLNAGDAIGHPSCEGGASTGTHIHIARKYNGEWISASGPLAFTLENWVAVAGERPYAGKLIRFNQEVIASEVSDGKSLILSETVK